MYVVVTGGVGRWVGGVVYDGKTCITLCTFLTQHPYIMQSTELIPSAN